MNLSEEELTVQSKDLYFFSNIFYYFDDLFYQYILDYGGEKSDEISRFEDLLHDAIDVAMAPGNDTTN